MDDFDSWCDRALAVWDVRAPSYVRVNLSPTVNRLRALYNSGATVEQFDEALEVAFQTPGVTKRHALFYAYAIVQRLVSEAK